MSLHARMCAKVIFIMLAVDEEFEVTSKQTEDVWPKRAEDGDRKTGRKGHLTHRQGGMHRHEKYLCTSQCGMRQGWCA